MLAALALTAACAFHSNIAAPRDAMELREHLEMLRDEAGALSLDAVSRAPVCEQFKPITGIPNFGGAGGGVWLRFRADLSAAPLDQWRLAVRFPGLDEVCAYWPLRSGHVASDCLRREAAGPDTERWRSGRLLFAVPPEYSSSGLVYVYAQSAYWLKVPMELATADALLQQEYADEFDWGLYFGLMLAFAAIGLLFFIGARDRAYLYFALHVAALSLGLLIWHGQLARFDPEGWSLTRAVFVLGGLFLASGSRFYQLFLDTGNHHRQVHLLLEACLWLGLVLSASMWFWPQPATRLIGLLALVWLGATLWATFVRLSQGYRPAILVLAAIVVLLAGIFFIATTAAGEPVLKSDLGLHLVQLGGLLAAGLLVFGMMFRVRTLIQERDSAGELALANQRLALHRLSNDELTGLSKRSKFRDELQERLARAAETGQQLALVSLGLDNFRAVSHALGQEISDGALAETALRLRQALRDGELVGVVGSDSFAWVTGVLSTKDDWAELRARCAAMSNTLRAPLARAQGTSLSISMGIALYPQHGNSAEQLLRNSDEALYRAQQQQSATVEIFQTAMRSRSERSLELSKELQQAIMRDELELHYQPVVPFDGSELFGVEALVRWRHKGKMIPPDQFVPVAESAGLIVPLSDWVLRRAGRQLADWRRRKLPVLTVSVNISANEFRLPGFTERIEKVLKDTSAPGSGLILELTEGVLVGDLGGAANILNRLALSGVKAAVDDFGVGYSSLAYLRQLPVQGIKIDRSFLKGVPAESEAVSVINAIITMGRELGLKITAEGIETVDQHRFLKHCGVSAGQGWLFAKAMPAAEFESWLQEKKHPAAA